MSENTYVPLNTLSAKMRVILRWLLSESTQAVVNSECEWWKITISGAGSDVRTVIEKQEKVAGR